MREALNRICALLLRTLSPIQFHFSNSGLSLNFDFLETSGERFLGNALTGAHYLTLWCSGHRLILSWLVFTTCCPVFCLCRPRVGRERQGKPQHPNQGAHTMNMYEYSLWWLFIHLHMPS